MVLVFESVEGLLNLLCIEALIILDMEKLVGIENFASVFCIDLSVDQLVSVKQPFEAIHDDHHFDKPFAIAHTQSLLLRVACAEQNREAQEDNAAL